MQCVHFPSRFSHEFRDSTGRGIQLESFHKPFTCLFSSTLTFSVRRHFVPRHIVPGHIVPGHILSRDNMSPGQYVALCPHYFAVQRGDILSQETYCPGSVRRHIVPGDVLSRLATNGNFGQQMHEGLLWLLWLLLLLILSMLSFGGFLAECLPCFNP